MGHAPVHAPLLYKGFNELGEPAMSVDDIFEQGNVFLAVLHMAGTCHGINCVYGLHARTEHSVQFNDLWSAQQHYSVQLVENPRWTTRTRRTRSEQERVMLR